ncbi:MAG: Ig-like domain-containing protein [Oscillospiraceae bacterium]|nr:Ig-like domain-containing protein [Oscillospiraceae bacterium]
MKAKRLFSLLLSLALLLSLLPALATTAAAAGGTAEPAQQSRRLESAAAVSVRTASELRRYLSEDAAYNITVAAAIDELLELDGAVWCTVRGAKSLDLNGKAVTLRDEASADSTLFLVEGGAWLELCDSLGGGSLRCDGAIQRAAQTRTAFAVEGAMLMSGGTVEAGHAEQVSIYVRYLPTPARRLYWAQVTGVGIAVRDGGSLILNGGSVCGRALAGIDLAAGAKAYLNGGTVCGYGGGDAVRGRPTRVTGGGYYLTDGSAFVSAEDQDAAWAAAVPSAGATVPEDCVEPGAAVFGDELAKTVVAPDTRTITLSDMQTLNAAAPLLTLPECARYYPELAGVWTQGATDALGGHDGRMSYQWELWSGAEWLLSDIRDSNSIDPRSAWTGFTPEPGTPYQVRCTVVEQRGALRYTSCYTAFPFCWTDEAAPVIVHDIQETQFFHVGDDVTLRVGASGEDLRYQWELFKDNRWRAISGENAPACTLRSLASDMSGMDVRCTVSNASGSVSTRSCRLKIDTERITTVAFSSSQFDRIGVDYGPAGLSVLSREFSCNSSGVRLKRVRWLAGTTAEGGSEALRCCYPGQTLRLELTFDFNSGVRPKSDKAKNLTVTLDGRAADGYQEMKGKDQNYESVFYWNFTAAADTAWDVPVLSLATAEGAVGDGCATSAAAAQSVGFAKSGDADARYDVTATAWTDNGSSVAPGTRFLDTENYRVRVTLSPAAPWRFSAGTVVVLDGEPCETTLLANGDLVAERAFPATKEATSQFTTTWDVVLGGTTRVDSENCGNVLGDPGKTFVFEPGSGEDALAAPDDAALMDGALYPNPLNGTSLGVLHINADYSAENVVLRSGESGLVIYVDGNVTLKSTAGRSVLELSADTTITGPGRLTLVTENAAPGSDTPVVKLNGGALRIVNTAVVVRGANGILGTDETASLELIGSHLDVTAEATAVGGLRGGLSVAGDCVMDEPEDALVREGTVLLRRTGEAASRLLVDPFRRAVERVTLDLDTLTLDQADSFQLHATVSPGNATDRSVIWTSSDPEVARVDSSGLVTALRPGTAEIAAQVRNGTAQATCSVTVLEKEILATGVELSMPNISIGEGAVIELRARVLPDNATDKRVFWYILDTGVARLEGASTEHWMSSETPVRLVGLAPGSITGLVVLSADSDLGDVTEWDPDTTSLTFSELKERLPNAIGDGAAVGFTGSYVPVEGIETVGDSYLVLRKGETRRLGDRIRLLPTNPLPSNSSAYWTSLSPNLHVDPDSGDVTALDYPGGEVKAEVWTGEGTWASVTFTVSVLPEVEGLSLSAPTETLRIGEGMQVNAYVYPAGAEERGVSWTSMDPAVATVDADGVVTALAAGTVTLTATTAEGGFTDSITLTVVPAPVTVNSVELSQSAMVLPVNGSRSLEVTVLPLAAADRSWSWTSSDSAVAVVENQTAGGCAIRAKAAGTATITFRTTDGNRIARLRVTVRSDYVAVTDIDVPTSIVLGLGKSARFAPVTVPANASEQFTVLRTEGTAGCVELNNGWVHGTSVGEALIRVRIGEQEKTCAVRVVRSIEGLTLDAAASLALGETKQLTASFRPADASDKTLRWSSSDEGVVTVDQSGLVTAVGCGTAWVTARNALSGFAAGCEVTVAGQAYELYVDGRQVTDANRATLCGGAMTYDPATNTLTVSGDCGGYADEPLIRSELDGLTVRIDADCALSSPGGVFELCADAVITGSGALSVQAYAADAALVTDGAALTVRSLTMTVAGGRGFVGAEVGETLGFESARVNVDTGSSAVCGFSGGIELSGCDLRGGARVSGGTVVDANGKNAPRIEIASGDVANDFNGDGAFDADDLSYLTMSLLRGAERYPLGGQSGDLNGDGATDFGDVSCGLFGSASVFDPARPLARFAAAVYDASGRLVALRVIESADGISESALAFLRDAAQVRLFYLDGSGAPLAKAGNY